MSSPLRTGFIGVHTTTLHKAVDSKLVPVLANKTSNFNVCTQINITAENVVTCGSHAIHEKCTQNISWYIRGAKIPDARYSRATKVFTVSPNICGWHDFREKVIQHRMCATTFSTTFI